uniref:TSA: Wollemia nobilis Ref_Wollemi_Transcript_12531_1084 transcribed RNA sequence n=1 Tax=Wollemia nobilis TaxID=56998 RepID=A0A0C9S800_9CONI
MAPSFPAFLLPLLFVVGMTSMMGLTTQALDLVVTNSDQGSDGGKRFDAEIGQSTALEILDSASKFVWDTFHQQSAADRKNVQKITLIVESMPSGVAFTANDEIHLSSEYVASFQGDVKTEIRGVLYHEVTHVWQWSGNGNAPGGLIEGIADYVRLTAGLAPSHWVKPGGGDRWDQGYDVTAYFLQYCESVSSGFVANMNAKLAGGWNVSFFNDLTGKSVDELWNDYKAKYASPA